MQVQLLLSLRLHWPPQQPPSAISTPSLRAPVSDPTGSTHASYSGENKEIIGKKKGKHGKLSNSFSERYQKKCLYLQRGAHTFPSQNCPGGPRNRKLKKKIKKIQTKTEKNNSRW